MYVCMHSCKNVCTHCLYHQWSAWPVVSLFKRGGMIYFSVQIVQTTVPFWLSNHSWHVWGPPDRISSIDVAKYHFAIIRSLSSSIPVSSARSPGVLGERGFGNCWGRSSSPIPVPLVRCVLGSLVKEGWIWSFTFLHFMLLKWFFNAVTVNIRPLPRSESEPTVCMYVSTDVSLCRRHASQSTNSQKLSPIFKKRLIWSTKMSLQTDSEKATFYFRWSRQSCLS